jgi:hypothetical protein
MNARVDGSKSIEYFDLNHNHCDHKIVKPFVSQHMLEIFLGKVKVINENIEIQKGLHLKKKIEKKEIKAQLQQSSEGQSIAIGGIEINQEMLNKIAEEIKKILKKIEKLEKGRTELFDSFANYRGIRANEIDHAVTENRLNYQDEAEAANESFSDILEACCEMYSKNISVKNYHWQVGDGIIKNNRYTLRSFLPGTAYENIPPLEPV